MGSRSKTHERGWGLGARLLNGVQAAECLEKRLLLHLVSLFVRNVWINGLVSPTTSD